MCTVTVNGCCTEIDECSYLGQDGQSLFFLEFGDCSKCLIQQNGCECNWWLEKSQHTHTKGERVNETLEAFFLWHFQQN